MFVPIKTYLDDIPINKQTTIKRFNIIYQRSERMNTQLYQKLIHHVDSNIKEKQNRYMVDKKISKLQSFMKFFKSKTRDNSLLVN